MIRISLAVLFFLCLFSGRAQPSVRKALFLGNSYTYVNNLPLMVSALAGSSGDSLYFDSNAPGGYTLGWQPIAHAWDPVSLAKIRSDPWDFVVLQEQSQTPAIPALRDSCMFPAANRLHDSVKGNHSCSRVLFFLTWGRRYGGIQCFTPNYCSPNFSGFDEMQDSLTAAYKMIADSLGDRIAPAGEAWRYVLHNSSMVLHDPDNSHPNLKGSYLAACVFYSCIFHKSSSGLSFTAGLPADTALFLQQAADSIVFGYASYWNLWTDEPVASFTFTTASDTLFTQNLSLRSSSWHWDFGDGTTSAEFEPVHVYSSAGSYLVRLNACDTCSCDSTSREVSIFLSGIRGNAEHRKISLTPPDPWGNVRTLNYDGNGDLAVFDLAGKLLCRAKLKSGKVKIHSLHAGWYAWVLENKEEGIRCSGMFSVNNEQ